MTKMKPRKHLTKSVFKVGLDCPRKLYYLNKPDEYLNQTDEDPFLEALARGGYQVGALAQLKYPGGKEITTRVHEDALEETSALLKSDSTIIYEAAFGKDQYFVRSDLAIKAKNSLRIIEVKSKSFKNEEDDDSEEFLNKTAGKSKITKLKSGWASYIYDSAFQVYVAKLQYPNLKITASIMLLDKASVNPEEGLHQMFLVKKVGDRGKEVILTKKPGESFKGANILKEIDLTELVEEIISGSEATEHFLMGPLAEKAKAIKEIYLNDEKYAIKTYAGSACKGCEFRGSDKKLKSGFDECWTEFANIKSASSKVLSIDLWNYGKAKEKAMEAEVYLLKDLTEDELGNGKTTTRQKIIIEKEAAKDQTPWFDKKGLKAEMEEWNYPLHFIDFETCTPAIPFKKGFSPYSEIAFQFSHHILHKDGKVEHKGEFIDLTPGNFPTFDFIRALKKQLESDKGSIFRYSAHENSVINRAIFLLEQSKEADKKELIEFLKTITKKKSGQGKNEQILWEGARNMIDLLEVLKLNYYSPLMGNSNSLKFVLPAILNESEFLKEKYSKPNYGTSELPSLNFKNHQWITFDGKTYSSDPYKELPPLFAPEELAKIETVLTEEESIRNGGAAMMAYSKSQYTEMSDAERAALKKALLKYCELDTLAMVMLVEYWKNVVKI